MTINSQDEWANAIEDAEQVMLRWGHGQVRRVPDEIVEAIVAALRAPVSERGPSEAEALLDWLNEEYVKAEPFNMPTGQGDADVGWRFSKFYQAEPCERVFYEHFRDDLMEAIKGAQAALSNER